MSDDLLRQSRVRLYLRALVLGAALAWSAPAAQQSAAQQSGVLNLTQAQGRVEVMGANNAWAAQTSSAPITTMLRTGTGRAVLQAGPRGVIIMGSASQLRRYQDEADLQNGRFLIRGPIGVHVRGVHLVMDGEGQARIDLDTGKRGRVAVISGSLRVALSKTVELRAGQQLSLQNSTVSAFAEVDPWYAAQFRGQGDATVEATRGLVRLERAGAARNASIGDTLESGARINTSTNAWAEIGFTGGGYLRLNADSELNVLGVERTSQGREVLLHLVRGTAWNVVQKGQGGYRIDTPVISTAVRGTVFRVDADGLVKVFDGGVSLPSQGDQPLASGQQRQPSGQVGSLQLDDLDRLNMALDAERARPLTLALDSQPRSMRELALGASSLPNTRVSALIAGQRIPLSNPAEGVYRLEKLEEALAEGRYRVQLQAQRYGKTVVKTQFITIDRSSPVIRDLKVERQGRLLTLSGWVEDALSPRVTLTLTGASATTYKRNAPANAPTASAPQRFQWLLPAPSSTTSLTLTVRDAAGNEAHAQIP